MKLVNGFELMNYAREHHYVLPAFNTSNMEMTYAIVRGLSNANLPGYVQISPSSLRLSSPEIIAAITRDAVKNTKTPIGLHLDHGKSFEDVKACVDAGFTSIMVDTSQKSFEDNIRETRKIVDYCHLYGLPVEAELGAIMGKEDDITSEVDQKTNPDLVPDFIEHTHCDALAVSVGNVHGLSLEPKIDLPLLKRIYDVSTVPLVLHGGSGIPVDIIHQAKNYGLIKINFGSIIRKEFIRTFGEAYENNRTGYDLIHLSLSAVENISKIVQELVTMINCNGERA